MSLFIFQETANVFSVWLTFTNVYASRCCTDLADNDLELTVIQGISYTVPNPKDVDTYVKFEFPYPSVSNILWCALGM
jgi:hypothetical protein